MRRAATTIGAAGLAAVCALAGLPAAAAPTATAPKGELNTLAELYGAVRGCWQWPPLSATQSGIDLTVMLSFKRNGEIFGARITYETRFASAAERSLYHTALLAALQRCSPLPVSPGLGAAIAGRSMLFRFHDTRHQRKASLHG